MLHDLIFRRRGHIEPDEKRLVRHTLQIKLLSGIAREFPLGEIIHHGGNGMGFGLGSPRYSEDLDFYLRDETWQQELDKKVNRIVEDVARELHEIDELHDVSIKANKDRPGSDGVQRTRGFTFRWAHSNRIGALKIKFEFCRSPMAFLQAYPSHNVNNIQHCDVVGAYCDKLVAIAMRGGVKKRDFYDVAWLGERITADQSERLGMLEQVAEIYGYTLDQVFEGLQQRIVDSPELHEPEKLAEQLEEWFDPEVYAQLDCEDILQRCRTELEAGLNLGNQRGIQP